jgi:hypothetical protein|tara:strand:+ start:5819 stop:6109 length:291 start_codon:yes stop_codon:yes gene_type:complete
MSKEINEISNLAKTIAAYIGTRAVLSNSDKIKKALGFKDKDAASDAAIRDLGKAMDKVEKSIERRLNKMDPEKRADIERRSDNLKQMTAKMRKSKS